MKSTIAKVAIPVAVLAIAVAILGISKFSQSDQDLANAEADECADRATRLLAKYQANVAQIGLILAQVGRQLGEDDAPVAVPPKGEEAGDLVRGEPNSFLALSKKLRDEAGKGRIKDLEQRLQQLVPDASSLPEMPSPGEDIGKSESAMAKGVKASLKRVDALVKENAKLLDQALGQANEALRIRHGEASTEGHVNANVLKAYVLYLQGEVKRTEGLASRLEAQEIRLRALRSAYVSYGLSGKIEELARRRPKQATETLASDKADLETRLSEAKKRSAGLTAKIEAIRKQITEAAAKAEAARKDLAALETKRYDPKQPKDVQRYVDAYAKHAKQEQEARLKAIALKTGTLAGVQLDDAQGGDLLKDKYVNAPGGKRTVVKGLVTLEKEQAEAGKEIADLEALLEASAGRAKRLGALDAKLVQDRKDLLRQKADIDKQVSDLLARAGKRAEVAAEAETEALARLAKAERAYGQAARYARQRVNELRDDPALDDLSEDKDTTPAMIMGQGGVAHARALVYLQQARDLRRAIPVIEIAAAIRVPKVAEDDVKALEAQLAEAEGQAVEAIDASVELIEKAAKSVNKNYRWIPEVSVAAANQLKSMATFGSDSAGAIELALEQYEGAVEGREASPFLKPYVRVLDQLRKTEGRKPPTIRSARVLSVPTTVPAEPVAEPTDEPKEAPSKPAAKPAPTPAPKPAAKPADKKASKTLADLVRERKAAKKSAPPAKPAKKPTKKPPSKKAK